MEKSLLAKPEYREQNNNVYLTLRNRVTAHEKRYLQPLCCRLKKNGQTTTTPKSHFALSIYKWYGDIVRIS